MDTASWPCPTCEDVRVFVQPDCADGCADDGGQCPEWACADCGTALFVGVVSVRPRTATGRRAA